MNKLQIRQLNKFQAVEAFMTANEADFPKESSAGRTATALTAVISNIETHAARKDSGEISSNVEIKAENFEKLDRLMRLITKAARANADEITGIEELYRLDGGRSEEARLARARHFYTQSAEHNDIFIESGLETTFRADLNALITAVSASTDETDTAKSERGGAVGALIEEFRKGNRHCNKLDNLVKIKYAENPEKLAAWLIASHQRAADSEDEEETPPTEGRTP
ncbi:MAG: hypothetical protein LUM44_12455 [Pyrinomonadaceae bacterium]|nr:hypothetical protein [Pyrinomonadaceae bacterium]